MPTAGVKVAIVEDDFAMRRSIERLLQASGYDTMAFACGQEFLDSDTAKTTDALVLDIHLEGMSGLDVQRRLRASGSMCPIIFITAYDDEATRTEALGLGCAAYLLKPFEAHQLTDALKRRLIT